jgi:hypothetical protein
MDVDDEYTTELGTHLSTYKDCEEADWLDFLLPELSRYIFIQCLQTDWAAIMCTCKAFNDLMNHISVFSTYTEKKYWKSVMICQSHTSNNLRMFDRPAFENIRFKDGRVASAKASKLLFVGSIVEEIDQISTENGIYLYTANGCMRYRGGNEGEVWLVPWKLSDAKHDVYEVVAETKLRRTITDGSLWKGTFIESASYDRDNNTVAFEYREKAFMDVEAKDLKRRKVWRCYFRKYSKMIYGLSGDQ